MIKAGIIGGAGYTAGELIRLLINITARRGGFLFEAITAHKEKERHMEHHYEPRYYIRYACMCCHHQQYPNTFGYCHFIVTHVF